MRETAVPMRLIDGPVDPNSGAHMAARYPRRHPERGRGDARRRHWSLAADRSAEQVSAHFLPNS